MSRHGIAMWSFLLGCVYAYVLERAPTWTQYLVIPVGFVLLFGLSGLFSHPDAPWNRRRA